MEPTVCLYGLIFDDCASVYLPGTTFLLRTRAPDSESRKGPALIRTAMKVTYFLFWLDWESWLRQAQIRASEAKVCGGWSLNRFI